MACHTLFLTSQSEFFNKLKSRESDLVIKMVKCVLNAIKRKRDKVDIFDITFKDTSELVFSLEKNQYHDLLKNCLNDLIVIEEYEICAEIKKQLDKAPKKQKPAKI
jgi:lipid II:glycine glycyltransferase (peptidoglycan interpeptide bridge formation enzyme)